jgi:hypothetical protein
MTSDAHPDPGDDLALRQLVTAATAPLQRRDLVGAIMARLDASAADGRSAGGEVGANDTETVLPERLAACITAATAPPAPIADLCARVLHRLQVPLRPLPSRSLSGRLVHPPAEMRSWGGRMVVHIAALLLFGVTALAITLPLAGTPTASAPDPQTLALERHLPPSSGTEVGADAAGAKDGAPPAPAWQASPLRLEPGPGIAPASPLAPPPPATDRLAKAGPMERGQGAADARPAPALALASASSIQAPVTAAREASPADAVDASAAASGPTASAGSRTASALWSAPGPMIADAASDVPAVPSPAVPFSARPEPEARYGGSAGLAAMPPSPADPFSQRRFPELRRRALRDAGLDDTAAVLGPAVQILVRAASRLAPAASASLTPAEAGAGPAAEEADRVAGVVALSLLGEGLGSHARLQVERSLIQRIARQTPPRPPLVLSGGALRQRGVRLLVLVEAALLLHDRSASRAAERDLADLATCQRFAAGEAGDGGYLLLAARTATAGAIAQPAAFAALIDRDIAHAPPDQPTTADALAVALLGMGPASDQSARRQTLVAALVERLPGSTGPVRDAEAWFLPGLALFAQGGSAWQQWCAGLRQQVVPTADTLVTQTQALPADRIPLATLRQIAALVLDLQVPYRSLPPASRP